MFVKVNARANAKKNQITQEKDGLTVHVTAPAKEGKANEAIAKALARHFGVSKSAVFVAKGAKSKAKLFKVMI